MKIVQLDSWLEFDQHIRDIDRRAKELESTNSRPFNVPLFRGLGSSEWSLKTTLERSCPLESSVETNDLDAYYQKVHASKPAIETLTEHQWDDLPEPPDFANRLRESASMPPWLFFKRNISVYRYFAYLRHHGFPSPLLDWTASPYVAAFFAFDGMPQEAKYVSIYAMLLDSMGVRSEESPYLTILGPYLRTHRRHLIQQSQYSVCLFWSPEYRFYPHDDAVESSEALGIAGELTKLNLPANDRTAALKSLDLMNINAFSLFGSEDSLVRTIGRRELLLKRSSG